MATCPACNADNHPAAQTCVGCSRALPLAVGLLVASRFEILDAIGRGGMGTVYRVRDHTLEEEVALKVLRGDLLEGDELARRFRSEIKVARRVGHRNVCRVFEYGEDGPLRYIAMELVDGVNLRHLVSHGGGVSAEEAFDAAIQAVNGLEAIHELGVVHRDIKSANIMRDRRGIVKLMDFGIARPHGPEGGDVTAAGTIVGTPEYMSPEQATGEKVDGRSDLYSMGVVIHELFAGVVPFRGETPVATILKHIQEPFVPSAAGLQPAVCPVLKRCLAKRPGERYATALELRRALEAAREECARSVTAGAPAAATVDLAAAPTARTTPKVVPPPVPVPTAHAPVSSAVRNEHTHTVLPGRLPASADLTLRPSATQAQAAPTRGWGNAKWVVLGAAVGLVGVAVVVSVAFRRQAPRPPSAPAAAATSPTPAAATTPWPAAPGPHVPEAAPESTTAPSATPRVAPPVRDPTRDIAAQVETIRRQEPELAYGRIVDLAGRHPNEATLREELGAQRRRLALHRVAKGREALGQAAAGNSPEAYGRAVELFDQALELDPTNADAQTGRAAALRGPARPSLAPDRVAFSLSDTTFHPAPLAAAPAGMGRLPPGVEVHAAQPPAPQARIVIELEPQPLRTGEAYVVRYFVFNQSQGSLSLMAASIKNSIGGLGSTGGRVELRTKLAPADARTLLLETRDTWRQDPSADWATTLTVVLEDGSVYSGTLHTRR